MIWSCINIWIGIEYKLVNNVKIWINMFLKSCKNILKFLNMFSWTECHLSLFQNAKCSCHSEQLQALFKGIILRFFLLLFTKTPGKYTCIYRRRIKCLCLPTIGDKYMPTFISIFVPISLYLNMLQPTQLISTSCRHQSKSETHSEKC